MAETRISEADTVQFQMVVHAAVIGWNTITLEAVGESTAAS